MRTGAECIRLARARADGVAVSRRLHGRARRRSSARTCCSRSAGAPTPTTSASTRRASRPTRAATSRSTTSLATNVPGHLGAGRLQRPRRLHPHRLQRLRDRGRQPARRRAAPGRATASPPTRSTSIRRSAASGMTETRGAASRPAVCWSASGPMTRVGRAIEKGETQGFMKVVVDAETRQILGAAILGTGGDEAIHGILDIMNANRRTTCCSGRCRSTPPSPSSSRPCSAR